MLKLEWDSTNDKSNQKKHGISFEEATTCFYDPMHILVSDPDSSAPEDRLVLSGMSGTYKLLVVVHLDVEKDRIRLISARKATKNERRQYEEV
jgi:uncharacterized DUF497 family protein